MGKRGYTALLTAAMIIAGIRMWNQLRGKTKTPFREWAVGWGALFFMLSLLSEIAPGAAGSFALMIAFTDFLVNGVSLTTDISKVVTGAEKGNTFVEQPFAAAATNGKVPAHA